MPADIKEFGQDEDGVEHSSDVDVLNDLEGDDKKVEGDVKLPVEEDDDDEEDESEESEESDEDDEDEEEDESDDDEEDEDEEDEESETKEDEDDAEEDDEESFSERPSLKTISKKFPEFKKILKEFPGLRQAYFNERNFREVFSTPDEAKAAQGQAEILSTLRDRLLDGEIDYLLQAVHEEKPEAVVSLAENFLPTLQKNAKGLYLKVIHPVMIDLIHAMHDEGVDQEKISGGKDTNLKNSAKFLAKFVTGKFDIPEKLKPREEKETKDPKLTKREEIVNERMREIATNFRDQVVEESERQINKRIDKQIAKFIDPNGAMKPLERRAVHQEIRRELSRLLKKDKIHGTNMSRNWDEAASKGFKSELIPSNVTAFLGRAAQLLPLARRKVQSEVLNDKSTSGKDGKKKKHKNKIPSSKGGVPSKKFDKKKLRGMSDEDFLNSD